MSCFIICSLLISGSIWSGGVCSRRQSPDVLRSSLRVSVPSVRAEDDVVRDVGAAASSIMIVVLDDLYGKKGSEMDQRHRETIHRLFDFSKLLVLSPSTLRRPKSFTLKSLPQEGQTFIEDLSSQERDLMARAFAYSLHTLNSGLAKRGMRFDLSTLLDSSHQLKSDFGFSSEEVRQTFYDLVMEQAGVGSGLRHSLTWAFKQPLCALGHINIGSSSSGGVRWLEIEGTRDEPSVLPVMDLLNSSIVLLVMPPYEGSNEVSPGSPNNPYQEMQQAFLSTLIAEGEAALNLSQFNGCITKLGYPVDLSKFLKPVITMAMWHLMSMRNQEAQDSLYVAEMTGRYVSCTSAGVDYNEFLKTGKISKGVRDFIGSFTAMAASGIPYRLGTRAELFTSVMFEIDKLSTEDWREIIVDAWSRKHITDIVNDRDLRGSPRYFSEAPTACNLSRTQTD